MLHDLARRLGAPIARCERCQQMKFHDELKRVHVELTSPPRLQTLCRSCQVLATEELRRVALQRVSDSINALKVKRDLERTNRTSSRSYRVACAAMVAEDPGYYRKLGWT